MSKHAGIDRKKDTQKIFRKNPKNSDTRKICCNHPKFKQDGFTVDKCIQKMQMDCKQCRPDQIASLGAV